MKKNKDKKLKELQHKEKKIETSILDLIPQRYYNDDLGCYGMYDDSYMGIFKIASKDLINSGSDIVELDCLKIAKFYQLYSSDIKIVSLNFPANTEVQRKYISEKISKTTNEIQKKWLKKKIEELEYLEKHTVKREYYFLVFGESQAKYEDNVRTLITNLGVGKEGLIEELPKIKKHQILFKLNNKNSIITSEHRLFG